MTRDAVVVTADLTKRYRGRVAVDRLSMSVRRGEVYGFVGPNGAGKTTTMRMLVGLVRPTAGTAWVLGAEIGGARVLDRVGALIEAPAFYPYLSGRDNLRVVARYAHVDDRRVDLVLERVGLSDRAGDRFVTYSTGMKQRLGVACAVLKDPDLLILDEPASGLDPEGMLEMRDLISGLAREGRTVLLSSHLLTDVQDICHRVGVIHRGRLLAEDEVDRLRGPAGLRVRAEPLAEARRHLDAIVGADRIRPENDGLRVDTDPSHAARIVRALVTAGVEVSEVALVERPLQEVFFDLIGHRQEDGTAAKPADDEPR